MRFLSKIFIRDGIVFLKPLRLSNYSLPVDEFIKRFSRHVLPKQFIKIRHYGYFSTRTKKVKLAL
ncbi:MAG: hypothetical protein ACJA08_002388, partial [Cyclobacteriaceae bacterium]